MGGIMIRRAKIARLLEIVFATTRGECVLLVVDVRLSRIWFRRRNLLREGGW